MSTTESNREQGQAAGRPSAATKGAQTLAPRQRPERLSFADRREPRPRAGNARSEVRRVLGRWVLLGFALGIGGAAALSVAATRETESLADWRKKLRSLLRSEPERRVLASSPAPVAPGVSTGSGVSSAAAPAVVSAAQNEALAASAGMVLPQPLLVATARQAYVYAEPSFDSRRLGYLRAGQAVPRALEPAGFEGCEDGFYRIEPQGYVCVGKWASIDPAHPAATALGGRPDRRASLPYAYGLSRYPAPTFYNKLPSYSERQKQEPDLDYHVRQEGSSPWRSLSNAAVPPTLRESGYAPRHDGLPQAGVELSSGRAVVSSGFAFLSLFASDGYEYGLSTDLAILPLDRLTPVQPSSFHGLTLDEQAQLPVAFVQSHKAWLYTGHPEGPRFEVKRRLDFREAVTLSGQSVQAGKSRFLQTTWGDWLLEQRLLAVEPVTRPPSWAVPGRRWIEVSLRRQTLVAYEGTRAVYVTLVSTGSGGADTAPGKHGTVQGVFLIHTKHVTWNLGASGGPDGYDLRDVPYVQYFHEGYALHAAYWHDQFGSPLSPGCVNLSPDDARWLFDWTEPHVPESWHGAYGFDGTLIHIHP